MQTILQRDFRGGELAPEFWGSSDLKQYGTALKTVRNFKINRAGKLVRAPGSIIVKNVITFPGGQKSPRIIPFILDATEGYDLVFENGRIWFIQDGEYVSPNPSDWSALTNYTAGQTVTQLPGNTYVAIQNVQAGISTSNTAYWFMITNGIYGLPSPYLIADLQDIQYKQCNAVLYLVHPKYPPQQLTFTVDPISGDYYFQMMNVPFVPTQQPMANNIGAIKSTTAAPGTLESDYLVTTVNSLTGEESFPGTTGVVGVATNVQGWHGIKFNTGDGHLIFNVSSSSGFAPGQSIVTNNSPNGFSLFGTVFSVGAGYIDVYFPVMPPGPPGTYAGGGGGTISDGGSFNISGITWANPCQVTFSNPTNLLAGDILSISGTGVSQLDGKIFYVTPITSTSTTQYTLNGIDSTHFNDTGVWTGAGSGFQCCAKVFNQGTLTPSAPNTIKWTNTSTSGSGNSVFFNVYAKLNGRFGFIGSTYGNSFIDPGIPPDLDKDPPSYNALFQTADNYPSAIEIYQQRLILGATNNNPLELDASRNGFLNNFTDRINIQADDAIVKQTLFADTGAKIKHFYNFGFLICFTDQHEIVLRGDSTGTLTPEEINATPQMFNGASSLRPLRANKSLIFVQANSSIIRDLQVTITPYGMTYIAESSELTLLSKHLVEGYSIVDWDYQKIYDSMIWAVRNDGIMISTPYSMEQGINSAWFRRDTNGLYGSIGCVPEDLEQSVYVSVQRKLQSQGNVWLIERFSSDKWTDIRDANYLDGAVMFDGRNTTDITMTLSLGTSTLWDGSQELTLTASNDYFTNAMIGEWIFLTGTDGYSVHTKIQSVTSTTVAIVTTNKTIPDGVNFYQTDGTVNANMRGVSLTTWGLAIQNLSGLSPYSSPVAIVGDGMVQANPLNLHKDEIEYFVGLTGCLTIPRPAVVIYVGLPYFSDLETLDFDDPKGDSLINKKTHLKQAVCMVTSTQGYWVGTENPDTNKQSPQNLPGPTQSPNYTFGLIESKVRDSAGYDSASDLVTGRIVTDFAGEWGYGSKLFIRCVDPIPCNFSAIGFAVDMPSIGK
jgi:hypothetical protein